MSVLEQHNDEIRRLCENHEVKNLYAFGSVLTGRFQPSSDIDLIVDFKERDLSGYADNYFEFKLSLESMFNRTVDLLEGKAIKNPFFKQAVLQQRQLIYAA